MAGKLLVRNLSKGDGPVAALLGWGNGPMRHLLKYSNIFENQDFTTICLTTPLVKFYMRPEYLATSYRKKIVGALQELTKDNPKREIFLMAFSQAGANVMASIIQHMESSESNSLNIVGTIYDSGPMMYSRSAVASAQGFSISSLLLHTVRPV